MPNQQRNEDTSRATAHLPGLEIEIVHRREADDTEAISINLQARPSFEAFGQYLKTANPFEFWFRAAEMVWLPWSAVAHPLMLPWAFASTPPKFWLGFDSKSAEDNA